jgi:hypothetical protein
MARWLPVIGQEPNPALPSIKLSGYVKTDVFYDSRQVVSAREGHFLLFPAAQLLEQDGIDINSKGSFNILPIQANMGVNVSGPSIFGGAVSALLEGDFFGQSNSDVNMFRLRHAYVKLQWSKTEVLAGQYWHPLFAPSCYPGTVSFNTGSPIQPFSRAPQLRIAHSLGLLKISLSLLSQRDYASNGPDGTSSKYLRDSGIPEIQFNGEFKSKNEHEFVAGMGFGFKKLTPQIKTKSNYITNSSASGISANVYMKKATQLLTFKLAGYYIENGTEYLAIGGYAIKDSLDVIKGIVSYAPMRTMSCWSEIHTNGKSIQFGVFGGYTQNLGTKSEVKGPFYLTTNMPVKSVYRISPRLTIKQNNFTLAGEVEFTSALYGTPDNHGIMRNTTKADNVRYLISVMYKF